MAAFIELALGEDSAVISRTGAALLEYTVGDRPVVLGMNAFDGAVLAPWPNRIADGRYDFRGRSHQLPITEPSRRTALHGLVANTVWDVADRDETSVALRTTIEPSPGYPFELTLTVTYTLREDAVAIVAHASNSGTQSAPFAFGFHPWIHPGAATVDEAQLLTPAQTWFTVDDRLIPIEERPFNSGTFNSGSFIPTDHEPDEASCIVCKDFRALRVIRDGVLDDAFGAPRRAADGWSYARLRGADDRTVVVGMDESFRAWQVCTGDELDPPLRRSAIAIEPMTCPPNAFAAGVDHDVIEPQGELRVEWNISLR